MTHGKTGRRAAGQCFLFEDCLPERLHALGMRGIERVLLHSNQTVMLSLRRRVLRIHRGYAFAPDEVLLAVVRFLNPRLPRPVRRAAEREFLAFPVHDYVPAAGPRRRERARSGDIRVLHRLRELRNRLNAQFFGGSLAEIPIRISSRMKSRLGELSLELRTGRPREIAIGRRHLLRHPWSEVEHTLLHELVHQWQAENGLPVDHGSSFRRKAREVGVLPSARRIIGPTDAIRTSA